MGNAKSILKSKRFLMLLLALLAQFFAHGDDYFKQYEQEIGLMLTLILGWFGLAENTPIKGIPPISKQEPVLELPVNPENQNPGGE